MSNKESNEEIPFEFHQGSFYILVDAVCRSWNKKYILKKVKDVFLV